jgi:hypothetical protein
VALTEKIIVEGFYPLDKCSEIAKNEGFLEAQALFDTKNGCYKESINKYLQVFTKNFDKRKLKKELYHFAQ